MKKLDFRTLPCPQPVIETKKALAEGGFSSLEIIVDNEAAKENVLRFLKNSGCKVEEIMQDNEIITIIAKILENNEENPDSQVEIASKTVSKGKCYIVSTATMGTGDETLGAKLMSAFFYTISEYENPPKDMFFLNGGIKNCIEDSENLEILKKITNNGTNITVCGTCLDFYKVTDKLKVGKIGNLYDLVTLYNGKDDIINIC